MSRMPALAVASALLGLLMAAASAVGGPGRDLTPPSTTQPNVCDDSARHLRCPDLVMSAPYDIVMDGTTRPGHVLLRATSSINNRGTGPLELRGHRRGARSMRVSQIIHRLGGGRAVVPTKALLGWKFVSGRRFGFRLGDEHYWKFRDAARFQLWSLDKEGHGVRVVRFGPKLFYCFRDLQRTRPSGRSPERAVYPACSENFHQRRVTLGTSVGWSDVYPYTYPEQWVDVTGLHGRFAFVLVADPYNRIAESNEHNNFSETYIRLPSGRILGSRRGVSRP